MRIHGILNQNKQIETLKQFALPFRNQFHNGPIDFSYQHDGCGPHRAKKLSGFLDANGVEILPWPAKSLESNPVENVLSIIKRRLRKLPKYLSIACSLYQNLCEVRNSLSED